MKLSRIKDRTRSENEGSHYHDRNMGVTVHADSHPLRQAHEQGEKQELGSFEVISCI